MHSWKGVISSFSLCTSLGVAVLGGGGGSVDKAFALHCVEQKLGDSAL